MFLEELSQVFYLLFIFELFIASLFYNRGQNFYEGLVN